MTCITKNIKSGLYKIFKRKKILNRLYFPNSLRHSSNIPLWRRAGEPTHDLHHQNRTLRPSQNLQKKKDIESFIFPTFPPLFHPHSLWRRTGEPTHDLHRQERQHRPSQNIQKKKDVKSFIYPTYPPSFHPHSFVAHDGGNSPQHDLPSPRATTPALTKYSKEERC
ncbi:hypothetical protein TNCV_1671171 [Trichonephila clavipes]|nr:hypothetical protein TNCV_1671171 [Trichonephila clavipes]